MSFKKLVLFMLLFFSTMVFAQGNPVLHDADGNTIYMSQLKEKWVVLNYWAAWCPSCLREIPELNNFYQHNRDKNVLLLSFNYDRLPKKHLKKAASKANITYPSLLEDPTYIWEALGDINFVPVTFIFSPDGKLAKQFNGSVTERELHYTLERLKREYA